MKWARTSQVYLVLLFLIGSGIVLTGEDTGLPLIIKPYHTAFLNITMRYPNGSPAADFRVVVGPEEKDYFSGPEQMTNVEGNAKFPLESNYWGYCYVYAQDLVDSRFVDKRMVLIEPDGHHELELTVNPPPVKDRTIHGTVTNRSTGLPVQGVKVLVSGFDIYDSGYYDSDMTDDNGHYSLTYPWLYDKVAISTDSPEYFEMMSWFFMEPGVYDYQKDLSLLPINVPMTNVQLKFTNSTTGQPLDGAGYFYDGNAAPYDHLLLVRSAYENAEGYAETSSPQGEYWFGFYEQLEEWNVSCSLSTGLIVEDVPIKREIGVPISEMAPMKLRLWNGTAPIESAYLYYNDAVICSVGRISYNLNAYTDSEGYAYFGVFPDRNITITCNPSGYDEFRYTFDPSAHTPPYELNLTMVESIIVPVPQGNINFIVRDPVTGVRVPRANVEAKQRDQENYITGRTNETGVLTRTATAGWYDHITVDCHLGSATYGPFEVLEGANPDMFLDIVRFGPPGDRVRCSLQVVDPDGRPIEGLYVKYIQYFGEELYWQYICTGEDGMLQFNVQPSRLVLWSDRTYNDGVNRYVFEPVTFDVINGSSDLGTIIAYPAMPTMPYSGHVKDGTTGEYLPIVDLGAFSYHMPEGIPLRSYMRDDPDLTLLSDLWSTSENDGRWKNWGSDSLFLYFERDGYFPKGIWITGDTRTDIGDVELEPLPPFDVTVDGRFVDPVGAPVAVTLRVFDKDRDSPGSIAYRSVLANGSFLISLYPGNFTFIAYMNEQMLDWFDVTVPPGGLSGLEFVLRDNAELEGFVTDASDRRLTGIKVDLFDLHTNSSEPILTTMTNEVGFYEFKVYEGDYVVFIGRTELYDPYESLTIETDGTSDIDLDIVLSNRSHADVMGTVTGSGGPYASGIPDATVRILTAVNETVAEMQTDAEGNFEFTDVQHGTDLKLMAVPPENLTADLYVRSGYLPKAIDLVVSGSLVETDLELEYYVLPPLEHINITNWAPVGPNIPLDEDIMVWFSVPVNRSSAESAFTIAPMIPNPVFRWDIDSTVMTVGHGYLLVNTSYHVRIDDMIVSMMGMGLWNGSVHDWSFTTVKEAPPVEPPAGWELFSVEVMVDDDKNVTVNAVGSANITAYFIIDDIWSFWLTPAQDGNRTVLSLFIDGSSLDWERTYSYHFSNISGGPDLAPTFSGTFTTPPDPNIIPVDDDDDDDDTGSFLERFGIFGACCFIVFVLLLILTLIVIVVLFARRKGEGKEE